MNETAMFVQIWGSYAAWLTLFARIAWRGKVRLLLMLSAAMLFAFATTWVLLDRAIAAPTHDHSRDIMGYGMLMLLAAAVLLMPIAIAAIVYPIGRLWAR